MAKHVTGDQYFELDGQLTEIKRQLRQQSGYPFDPEALRRHLQSAIEGRFGSISAYVLVNNKTKDGWTLVEHCPRRITSVRDLELVSFLKQDENSVKGEEMVRRARVELDASYGQEDAEWLLGHQNEIPVEFQKYYLVFTGTIWRGSYGRRYVSYLFWDGEHWCLSFFWLGHDFFSGDRLVRPRK